ncbi:hypothetical protein GCM10022629_79050 [Amorphoplanes auranticolor]
MPGAGTYGAVTFCGASDDAVVEARMGAADTEADADAEGEAVALAEAAPGPPVPVGDEHAVKAPAPAVAASPASMVRLRMVTILRHEPVLTLRIVRAVDHTPYGIRLRS